MCTGPEKNFLTRSILFEQALRHLREDLSYSVLLVLITTQLN